MNIFLIIIYVMKLDYHDCQDYIKILEDHESKYYNDDTNVNNNEIDDFISMFINTVFSVIRMDNNVIDNDMTMNFTLHYINH